MDNRITGVGPSFGLHRVGERRRRSHDEGQAFEEALGDGQAQEMEEAEQNEAPKSPAQERTRYPIRRDDEDGSLHVDVLA